MKIVYFTLTGNTEMFAKKLNAEIQRITKFDRGDTIEEPYILLLPTYEAAATKTPFEFVRNNLDNLIGIVGSGNRNFGRDLFCFSAQDMSKETGKPILHMYEFQGSPNDVNKINEIIKDYDDKGYLDPKYIMKI